MAKDKLTEYSATNASNDVIGDISVAEGMLPSAVNNALREQMTHLKNFADGTDAINALAVDNLKLDGNTISSTDTNGDITIDPDGTGDTIIASGNLGVGTSSPDFKAEIVGATNDGLHIKDAESATVFGGLFTQASNMALVARSNHALTFGTNDAERMRISNTGIVTTPAQPAFRAVSTGSWTIPTSTFTIFPANSAVFNVGGGYNTGTYKFTAPVDGVYYFAGQWFGSVGSGRAIASIYKNDAQTGGSQSLSVGSTSGGGISYATQCMMQLDAGDTASFQTYQESGGTVTANQSSHLSFWYGYLLG